MSLRLAKDREQTLEDELFVWRALGQRTAQGHSATERMPRAVNKRTPLLTK